MKLTHNNVSYIKSAFRIIAGGFIISNMLVTGGIFIILAEMLGIAEELV